MVFEKMSDKNLGLKSVSDKSVKIYLSDMKKCMLNKNVAYLKALNDICLILCFIKSCVYSITIPRYLINLDNIPDKKLYLIFIVNISIRKDKYSMFLRLPK